MRSGLGARPTGDLRLRNFDVQIAQKRITRQLVTPGRLVAAPIIQDVALPHSPIPEEAQNKSLTYRKSLLRRYTSSCELGYALLRHTELQPGQGKTYFAEVLSPSQAEQHLTLKGPPNNRQ